jgi:hypothetical protein
MKLQADRSVCGDVPRTFSVVWSWDCVFNGRCPRSVLTSWYHRCHKPLELHNWLIEWRRQASQESWQPVWINSIFPLTYRLFLLPHEHFYYILSSASFVLSSSSLLYLRNDLHLRQYIEIGHDCFICDHTTFKKVRLSYPCNRQWRPIGLWDVEAPTFSRQSAHRW